MSGRTVDLMYYLRADYMPHAFAVIANQTRLSIMYLRRSAVLFPM